MRAWPGASAALRWGPLALAALVLAGPVRDVSAEDDPPDAPVDGTLSADELKKARALFDEAVAAQERRDYGPARKKFRRLLDEFPGAPSAMRQEAEERSDENCFLGFEQIHVGGPSENRVDVELMGDGYLITQQEKFRKHAEDQLKEFWREPLYDEYGSYLNIWRFDLASKEEGVDDVDRSAGGAGPGADDPNRPKKKKRLREYSTALNCQAAGPQNQVWADPDMVMKWRKYLKVTDDLSICFAKKGSLGMGGGGIATTGRRVAVVHEFGHAFIGLLDEYVNNGGAPPFRIAARNAISGKGEKEPPDPAGVPWKHWLDAKNDEVGLLLGGATYALGVWRPAASCAMNSGGSSPLCWVCREAGVLMIYEYVNPIDEAVPVETVISLASGGKREFSVTPMAPKRHRLSTEWRLEKVKERVVTRAEDDDEALGAAEPAPPFETPVDTGPATEGYQGRRQRGILRHAKPWPPGPPRGEELPASEKTEKGGAYRSTVVLENLPAGRYRLTARVRDDTRIQPYKFPWVIRDPDKLLEERREWLVLVGQDAPPPPAK